MILKTINNLKINRVKNPDYGSRLNSDFLPYKYEVITPYKRILTEAITQAQAERFCQNNTEYLKETINRL
jgi:hypothetical protein